MALFVRGDDVEITKDFFKGEYDEFKSPKPPQSQLSCTMMFLKTELKIKYVLDMWELLINYFGKKALPQLWRNLTFVKFVQVSVIVPRMLNMILLSELGLFRWDGMGINECVWRWNLTPALVSIPLSSCCREPAVLHLSTDRKSQPCTGRQQHWFICGFILMGALCSDLWCQCRDNRVRTDTVKSNSRTFKEFSSTTFLVFKEFNQRSHLSSLFFQF